MKTELGRTSVAEGAAERPRAATGVEILPAASGEGLLRPLGSFSRDGFGGFLPQPPYFSGGPRRGFTFGLPAHRSFRREHFMLPHSKRTRGPYIPGFKSRGLSALKRKARGSTS